MKNTDPHPGYSPRSEFVGRRTELAHLCRILSGTVDIMHVSGIAGVGKSWLAEEYANELLRQGTPLAFIDFRYQGSRDPVIFMTQIADQLPTLDWHAFHDTVASFDARLDASLRLMPPLSSLPPVRIILANNRFEGPVGDIVGMKFQNVQLNVPEGELQHLREQRLRQATEAFRRCLQDAECITPVIFLDSLETILGAPNTATQEPDLFTWMWGELVDRPVPLPSTRVKFLMFGQGNPPALRPSVRLRNRFIQLRLDAFTEEEAFEFLSSHCERSPTSTEARILFDVTKRHPLCMSLAISLLNEAGWVPDTHSVSSLAQMETALITEVLVARILENVKMQVAHALRLFAVPRSCDEHLLAATLGEEEAAGLWPTIVRLPFVSPTTDGKWELHELVRSLILKDFRRNQPDRIKDAHHRLANVFLNAVGPDWPTSPVLPDFLFHFIRSEDSAARSIAARFARFALRTRNSTLAKTIWGAIKTADVGPSSAPWLTYCRSVDQILSGEAPIVELQNIWNTEEFSPVLRLMAVSAMATAAQRSGNLDHASHWAAKALAFNKNSPMGASLSPSTSLDNVVVAACFNDLATILRTQIRLQESLEMYQQVRQIVKDASDEASRWEAAYALLYQGVIYTGGLSQYLSAEAAFRAAENEFRALDDIIGVVLSAQRLGWLARMRGDLDTALREHQRARSILPPNAEPLLVGELTHSTANVLRQLGQSNEARDHYLKALQIFRTVQANRHEGLLHKDLGELLIVQGKTKSEADKLRTGIEELRSSLRLKRELNQINEASPVLALLGEALTELSEFDEARAFLREGLAIARSTRVSINEARCLAKLAVLALRDPRSSEAGILAAATVSLASAKGFPHYEAEGLVVQAKLASQDGNPTRAADLLMRSLLTACQYNRAKASEMIRTFRGDDVTGSKTPGHTVLEQVRNGLSASGIANACVDSLLDEINALLGSADPRGTE